MQRLSEEQLEQISRYDVPTICNAIETFKVRSRIEGFGRPGLLQRTGSVETIVGYAVTAKVAATEPGKQQGAEELLLQYYRNVSKFAGHAIAVIQDIDAEPLGSFWGDVQASVHRALGSIGTIVEGGIRDIPEVNKIGFPMYSTHILASHGYVHMEECDVPVQIRGLTVRPGDLLCVDCHGVVQVPHEIAPRLAEACQKVMDAENPVLDPCKAAIAEGRYINVDDLREWRAEMARRRNS